MGLGPKICDLNTQNVKITASKTKKVGFIEYTNKMAVLFTYYFYFLFCALVWGGIIPFFPLSCPMGALWLLTCS